MKKNRSASPVLDGWYEEHELDAVKQQIKVRQQEKEKEELEKREQLRIQREKEKEQRAIEQKERKDREIERRKESRYWETKRWDRNDNRNQWTKADRNTQHSNRDRRGDNRDHNRSDNRNNNRVSSHRNETDNNRNHNNRYNNNGNREGNPNHQRNEGDNKKKSSTEEQRKNPINHLIKPTDYETSNTRTLQQSGKARNKTRICQNVLDKKKCPYKICFFAHSICELIPQECLYNCKSIKCKFIHGHETKEMYLKRLQINCN